MNYFKNYKLFCPGPVNTHFSVKKAAASYEIGHREPEFSTILTSLNKKILDLFVANNSERYHPVFITGSGTAANEAVFASIGKKIKVLIIANGEFGERLFEISQLHNNAEILSFEWGESINLVQVEKKIKQLKPDFVAVVHHETSTGMLNPIEKIGQICNQNGIKLFIDAVSSLGAEKIDLDKVGFAFLTSSSGKAIASLPGIGIIIGKNEEFQTLKNVKGNVAYLNLYKLYVWSITLAQTPCTPAVQLFCALEQAVSNILNEDPESRRDYIRALAEKLRDGLKGLGFEFLIDESEMCSMLTTVKVPEFIRIESLKDNLRQQNIIVYNGKGPLKDKFFQIANIGNIKPKDVDYLLKTLESIMAPFRLTKFKDVNVISRMIDEKRLRDAAITKSAN